MAKQQLHDINFLRKLLSYDPETGAFIYRPRPVEMFKSRRAHSIWSQRCSEKPAFASHDEIGYCRTTILGVQYRAHRMAWALSHGEWPESSIDHINGDTSDNRLSNLRSVSHQENCKNLSRPSNNISGVIGVSWCEERKKWVAQITRDNKKIGLGRYNKLYEAVIARKAAEKALGFHENHGR